MGSATVQALAATTKVLDTAAGVDLAVAGELFAAARALGVEPARPPAQRNGAGVFGALIASTGNIAGAAAPAASALAPDIKRPGYHLSRCASPPLHSRAVC